MRILVFGMSTNICGGIESFLLNMNKFMSDDCIFDYVLLGNSAVFENAIQENGGKAIYVTSYRKNPFKYILELIKVLKENKNDHKAAYFNLFSMVHMLPVLFCRIFGYKIILHSHNNNLQQSSKLYKLLHKLNRALFGKMKCLRLTTSDASTEFMFGKKKNAELIYNAIDVEKFKKNWEYPKRSLLVFPADFLHKKIHYFLLRLSRQYTGKIIILCCLWQAKGNSDPI